MRRAALFAAVLALAWPAIARADQESGNRAYVAASQHGNCYARSIPSRDYGTQGRTRTYIVAERDEPDREIARFDWFAPQIRLECNVENANGRTGVSVVQIGPWPRGSAADNAMLAFAFYWNGVLLRSYSTLDIAGRPDNVHASVSHYTVVEEIVGYEWRGEGNHYNFIIRTTDGRTLTFDAGSGTLLSTEQTSSSDVP